MCVVYSKFGVAALQSRCTRLGYMVAAKVCSRIHVPSPLLSPLLSRLAAAPRNRIQPVMPLVARRRRRIKRRGRREAHVGTHSHTRTLQAAAVLVFRPPAQPGDGAASFPQAVRRPLRPQQPPRRTTAVTTQSAPTSESRAPVRRVLFPIVPDHPAPPPWLPCLLVRQNVVAAIVTDGCHDGWCGHGRL